MAYGEIQKDKHRVSVPAKKQGRKVQRGRNGTRARRGGRISTGSNVTPDQNPVADGRVMDPEIAALVRLRYGAQDLALAQQRQNIDNWFPQYQARIAAAAGASQGYYAGLQQANQQAVAQQQQGTNLGAGVSADTQAQAQLAAQSRGAMQGAFGQAIGAAGAAQGTFLQNQGVVGGAAQLQQRLQNQQATTALAAEKGDYAVKAKTDRDAAARQAQLEDAALGIKTQTERDRVAIAQQGSRDKAAQRRATAREGRRNREAAAEQKRLDREAKAKEQKAKAKGGDLTPKEAREARVTFRRAITSVKRNPTHGTESLYNELVDAGYDPVIARAAVQTVRKGRVGPKTARAMEKDYGIRLPRRGGRGQEVVAIHDRPPTSPGPRNPGGRGNGGQRPN